MNFKNIKKDLIKISKEFNLDLLILSSSKAVGQDSKNSDWDFAFFTFKEIN